MTDSTSDTGAAGATTGQLTTQQFQAQHGTEDWRGLGRGAFAWFAAASHAEGAALTGRVLQIARAHGIPTPDVDLRSSGVQIRLAPRGEGFSSTTIAVAAAISHAAHELGLTPRPDAVQEAQVTIDALEHGPVMDFWARALGYQRDGDEDLVDPLRRHLPLWFQEQDAPRPLRNRIHLDSVAAQPVSAAAVEELGARGADVQHHDYYATVADPEGNEVDLLPLPDGSDRWDGDDVEDWRLVFDAVASYPTTSADETEALVSTVARLADEAGLPLAIDVRPDESRGGGRGEDPAAGRHGGSGRPAGALVVLSTGKDRWEMDEGYRPLAARVQAEARSLGLTAEHDAARFVQVGLDAADIPAARRFWLATLGYEPDPRPDVTDIVDPRGLGPVLFFQGIDEAEEDRRAQRNRLHVDVFLPHDVARARVEAAVAAGGRVVRDMDPFWWTVADPEGNEVDLSVTVGREEHWG